MRDTVNNHIRAHILAGTGDRTPGTLKKTEWNIEFEELMRARLQIGAFRYGCLHFQRPKQGHTKMIIDYINRKLKEYEETGNKEMLVDIANLALIEFEHSDHPKKHFKSMGRED